MQPRQIHNREAEPIISRRRQHRQRDDPNKTAAKLVLEPIFESDFKDCSYGFRPGRSATQALEALRLRGSGGKGNHVLDADIRDFFGSLDREILMKRVRLRVSDRRVLRLIGQWLEAGVMEDGRHTTMLSGTPQGGVISPLLSNIYLSFLDEQLPRPERPPVSRVREIRTHGLNGGLTHTRRKTEEG